MATEAEKNTLAAAIHDAQSRPETATWELGTLRASISDGDPELLEHFDTLTGPEQLVSSMHLEGGTVEGHSTGASELGTFISKMGRTAREIVKDKAQHKNLVGECILVDALNPGSVEVVFRAAESKNNDKHQTDADQPAVDDPMNLNSRALRDIGRLLSRADADSIDNTDLDDEVSQLPKAARSELRGLARQVTKSGWSVSGTSQMRGYRPERISFGRRGADSIVKSIDRVQSSREVKDIIGRIDGLRWSSSTVHFVPSEGKSRLVAAKVHDTDLLTKAAAILADDSEMIVRASVHMEQTKPKEGSDVPQQEIVLLDVIPVGIQTEIELTDIEEVKTHAEDE